MPAQAPTTDTATRHLCEKCGEVMIVHHRYLGRQLKCRNCGHAFTATLAQRDPPRANPTPTKPPLMRTVLFALLAALLSGVLAFVSVMVGWWGAETGNASAFASGLICSPLLFPGLEALAELAFVPAWLSWLMLPGFWFTVFLCAGSRKVLRRAADVLVLASYAVSALAIGLDPDDYSPHLDEPIVTVALVVLYVFLQILYWGPARTVHPRRPNSPSDKGA